MEHAEDEHEIGARMVSWIARRGAHFDLNPMDDVREVEKIGENACRTWPFSVDQLHEKEAVAIEKAKDGKEDQKKDLKTSFPPLLFFAEEDIGEKEGDHDKVVKPIGIPTIHKGPKILRERGCMDKAVEKIGGMNIEKGDPFSQRGGEITDEQREDKQVDVD